jgi:predicted small secreted protein
MTTIGSPKRFFLLASIVACFAVALTGCNGETDNGDGETNANGSNTSANGTSGASGDATPEVESEALATVLRFQQAVLDLDLERAQALVDEATPAYESVSTAMTTLELLKNPEIDDDNRQLAISMITDPWRGATAEVAVEEGNSAIIAVTRSNGDVVDVNLNYFDGKWLINSPANVVELR